MHSLLVLADSDGTRKEVFIKKIEEKFKKPTKTQKDGEPQKDKSVLRIRKPLNEVQREAAFFRERGKSDEFLQEEKWSRLFKETQREHSAKAKDFFALEMDAEGQKEVYGFLERVYQRRKNKKNSSESCPRKERKENQIQKGTQQHQQPIVSTFNESSSLGGSSAFLFSKKAEHRDDSKRNVKMTKSSESPTVQLRSSKTLKKQPVTVSSFYKNRETSLTFFRISANYLSSNSQNNQSMSSFRSSTKT